MENAMDTTETPVRTRYTIPPPRYPSANDKEKSDVAATGPMARMMETSSCARPFVVPKDARLGDAAVR